MIKQKTPKKILIAAISFLFFMVILVLVGMAGAGDSIGISVSLLIVIVLGTFLLNRYATSYNIFYLLSIFFLALVILFFLATIPFSIAIYWQIETFIMVSVPILYITIMRPKLGWAIGIIVALLIILFQILSAGAFIPLKAIKRTLIVYLIMMSTGIGCGLLGEYIGKRLREYQRINGVISTGSDIGNNSLE